MFSKYNQWDSLGVPAQLPREHHSLPELGWGWGLSPLLGRMRDSSVASLGAESPEWGPVCSQHGLAPGAPKGEALHPAESGL